MTTPQSRTGPSSRWQVRCGSDCMHIIMTAFTTHSHMEPEQFVGETCTHMSAMMSLGGWYSSDAFKSTMLASNRSSSYSARPLKSSANTMHTHKRVLQPRIRFSRTYPISVNKMIFQSIRTAGTGRRGQWGAFVWQRPSPAPPLQTCPVYAMTVLACTGTPRSLDPPPVHPAMHPAPRTHVKTSHNKPALPCSHRSLGWLLVHRLEAAGHWQQHRVPQPQCTRTTALPCNPQ